MVLGFGSYNYVFYLLLTWLPELSFHALHIDLLHSFLYTGLPWLVATLTDLVIGGWLVDALIRRGWDASRVRKTVLICGTAFGLGILGAANTHDTAHALIWISISIGGLSAASPVGWSIPSLIAPRSNVGSVGGIINFSNQLSGIAAPIITGYLVSESPLFCVGLWRPAIYLADRYRRLRLPTRPHRTDSTSTKNRNMIRLQQCSTNLCLTISRNPPSAVFQISSLKISTSIGPL